MKAGEANFLKFLAKSDQLEVPIYQRTYSWSRTEILQLWSDVVRLADDQVFDHFVGSIVYIDTGIHRVTAPSSREVIDGQQRLATISLLILALIRAMEAAGADGATAGRKLMKDYLLEDEDAPYGSAARYKLLLTKSDRETFIRLIDGKERQASDSPRLIETYDLFVELVHRTTLPPHSILEGLGKFVMVDIALERDHDNPQLIFESLNSTGMDLSQADLIRNYVLMGLPPNLQRELYYDSWYPLERSFPAAQPELFDRFMRDYLTMRTGQIPKVDHVYQSSRHSCGILKNRSPRWLLTSTSTQRIGCNLPLIAPPMTHCGTR